MEIDQEMEINQSEMMPINGHETVVRLERVHYFLRNAVRQPQPVQAFVALSAQLKGVAALQTLIRLTVCIQVRRRKEASFIRTTTHQ